MANMGFSDAVRNFLKNAFDDGYPMLLGTSGESVQHAVRNGVRRAAQTIRHLDWFEVTDIRGHIVDGDVEHFQVTMKVGFRLEDV